jgi:endoglucanase
VLLQCARRLFVSVIASVILSTTIADAASNAQWPAWERFKQLYISADGRVIDDSVPEQITTSEGQSYALFFALVANDRETFARLLRWTQNNLARGDLAKALPAWQWGRASDGTWRVLDPNSASDSDLWIAYTLLEAGRLWCDPSYTALGRSVTARILREEVTFVPGLGPTLLPGPKGFVAQQTWRLNASYVPIQVLRTIARHAKDKLWNDVIQSSERLILASAPRGFAADWIQYRAGEGFIVDRDSRGIGSYNAIRVYLWAGTLAPADPLFSKFARQLAPMMLSAAERSAPVESVDTRTLAMQGNGSPGFSAALLPMFTNAKQTAALVAHRARVETEALRGGGAYYSDVLSLFGLGWVESHYRFDAAGQVQLKWQPACRGAR